MIYDVRAMTMRVLIADRNARLLESVSCTFAPQFSIQTATTHERCNELLQCQQFDLAVVSEKLADVPGLHLLGQIARSSPGTLRVFAARESRLELLQGKLGPFRLFRTLAYPIDPRELQSALTLARISLTSAEAMFAINVPMTIAAMPRVRRSNSSAAPRVVPVSPAVPRPAPSPPPAARSAAATPTRASGHRAPPARSVAPESPGEARQSRRAAASHSQRLAPQLTPQAAPTPRAAPTLQLAPTLRAAPTPQPGPAPRPGSSLQPAPSPPVVARYAAPSRLLPQSDTLFELIGERRDSAGRVVSGSSLRQPMRTKVVLGATAVVVFLATTLILRLFDSRVHVTPASASRPEIAQSDIPAPPPNPTPVLTTPFSPATSVAKRAAPKPVAADPDDEPADPQVTASNTPPVADPSTFGSEAYEPIYSN